VREGRDFYNLGVEEKREGNSLEGGYRGCDLPRHDRGAWGKSDSIGSLVHHE